MVMIAKSVLLTMPMLKMDNNPAKVLMPTQTLVTRVLPAMLRTVQMVKMLDNKLALASMQMLKDRSIMFFVVIGLLFKIEIN
jgi:hypothetical protein